MEGLVKEYLLCAVGVRFADGMQRNAAVLGIALEELPFSARSISVGGGGESGERW